MKKLLGFVLSGYCKTLAKLHQKIKKMRYEHYLLIFQYDKIFTAKSESFIQWLQRRPQPAVEFININLLG